MTKDLAGKIQEEYVLLEIGRKSRPAYVRKLLRFATMWENIVELEHTCDAILWGENLGAKYRKISFWRTRKALISSSLAIENYARHIVFHAEQHRGIKFDTRSSSFSRTFVFHAQ